MSFVVTDGGYYVRVARLSIERADCPCAVGI